MKIIISWCLVVLTATTQFSYGMDEHEDFVCKKTRVHWKKDMFGNILPDMRGVDTQQLADFVSELQEKEHGNAFIVQLPHEEADKAVKLRAAGFKPHSIDDRKSEWVIKNGSPMPEASTAAAGARVAICRGKDVLVIEDKNMRGRMVLPGGSVDAKELALDAASREIKEELGLSIKNDALEKIAIVNRVRANRYGYSDYCHYYLTHTFEGTLKIQENEVLQAFWYPLEYIARGATTQNLKISHTMRLLASHILSGGETRNVRMLDPRQYSVESSKQDHSDVMDIDLLGRARSHAES